MIERPEGEGDRRLQALLAAAELITSELPLDRVLQHIVDTVREVADARYAALGVIAADGTLEEFVHSGIAAPEVERIGALPQGKGLLGALINRPDPIRLDNLARDPRSIGFPAGHPAMISFLGVPVRVRGEVFGNLYLTESGHGCFSAEDEKLVTSLALAAGSAISNARRAAEWRRRQRWLEASFDITAQLLTAAADDPLHTIAHYASDIADADLVSIGVIAPGDRELGIEVAIGERADLVRNQRFELDGTLAGRVASERAPLLIRAPEDAGDIVPALSQEIDAGPIMVIPMLGTERVLGVLNIVRRRGAEAFSSADLEMAAAFAGQASVALELAAARSEHHRVAVLEDRDRIARDLHDHVIQQLFAIGLGLQGLAVSAGPDTALADSLVQRVEEIDRTIRQIRTSIFALRGPFTGPSAGLRGGVLQLSADLTPILGFSPGVIFAGPVDTVVETDLADDINACVREGLTNVAKYAGASRASVDIAVDDAEITVRIADDGAGVPANGVYSGLRNLRERAELRGGTFRIATPPGGGTELIWTVPLP
jgi:signal transduction histidine kinase